MHHSPCCFQGFQWEGSPVGRTDKLTNLDTYITGDNPSAAVLIIHDVFGWTFPNIRLLADHFAKEANVTAYVPDVFGGKILDYDLCHQERYKEAGVDDFLKRNSREIREPQILAFAKYLRGQYNRVGAAGYCYGGWVVFRLGSREHDPPLVDCIISGHPSDLTKADIDDVGVPFQMLAPEIDPNYTPELKLYTFQRAQTAGVPFDYQHFPGVGHSCLTRGDDSRPGERSAMIRGKDAAVRWLQQYLHIE
jgi:dienelactone hydrolase